MKIFMATDLTQNRKNEKTNGDEFIIAKPSPALVQAFERTSEKVGVTIGKSLLSTPLRIGKWICKITSIIIVVALLKSLVGKDSITLSKAYQNAAWVFWLGGACLVIWCILEIISAKKLKSTLNNDETEPTFDNLGKACDAIFLDLAVPSDCKEVDILSFRYKEMDGKIKVCGRGLQETPYLTPVFNAFTDSENLYLVNLDAKYAIALSSIKAIKTVKKTICTDMWNKEEEDYLDCRKQFRLSETDSGGVICKWYHIIEFENNEELWGIYIPSYELPSFEELTGLKAQ